MAYQDLTKSQQALLLNADILIYNLRQAINEITRFEPAPWAELPRKPKSHQELLNMAHTTMQALLKAPKSEDDFDKQCKNKRSNIKKLSEQLSALTLGTLNTLPSILKLGMYAAHTASPARVSESHASLKRV